MQQAMRVITDDDNCSETDVLQFISDCNNAEEESNREGEQVPEEEEEEEQEEEEGGGDEAHYNEFEANELKYLIRRLDQYVSRRGPLAKDVFRALKNDLLGPHHQQ